MEYRKKVEAVMQSANREGEMFVTAVDLMEASMKVPYPVSGDSWGAWRFDAERLTLNYIDEQRGDLYEIYLDEMSSSSHMLDWIMQIQSKTWASAKDIGDLVQALADLFDPQSTLCSMGSSKQINAGEFLKKNIEVGIGL